MCHKSVLGKSSLLEDTSCDWWNKLLHKEGMVLLQGSVCDNLKNSDTSVVVWWFRQIVKNTFPIFRRYTYNVLYTQQKYIDPLYCPMLDWCCLVKQFCDKNLRGYDFSVLIHKHMSRASTGVCARKPLCWSLTAIVKTVCTVQQTVKHTI